MTTQILESLQPLAVAIDSLHFDAANARMHNDRNLDAIKASLAKFGQRKPIVVQRDGMIVRAGNGTMAAAKALGWTEIAAVVVDEGDVEATAYAIADNKTAELASWDEDVLADLMTALHGDAGIDELVTGFSDREIEQLLRVDAPITEEDIPDLPDEPVSRPGDLWTLGPHRLLVGDSTSADDVARLMDGDRAACMWTDPPFGVRYVGGTKDALTIENDTAEGLDALLAGAFSRANEVLQPGAPFYIAHPAGALSLVFQQALVDVGWRHHQTLVWVKDSLVLGHSDHHFRHEPILYGWTPGPGRSGRGNHDGSRWYGDDSQTTVIEVPRPKRSTDHPTSKPIELVARGLRNSTKRADIVFEPFAGSGSTLIACEQLERVCRALEIDPRYADVVVRRWEATSGEKAERVSA